MRAVSPSRQSPPVTPPEPQPDKKKSARVARNAAIAGAIGAGISVLGSGDHPIAGRVAKAVQSGAYLAATAGTFTALDGPVWKRGLMAVAAGNVAAIATGTAANAALLAGGVIHVGADSKYHYTKFGADHVTRPYV